MTHSATVSSERTFGATASPPTQDPRGEPVLRLATPGVQEATQRDLHAFAIHADSLASECVQLSSLWQGLKSGRYRVVDSGFTDHRCYLVLAPHGATEPFAEQSLRLRIVEGILCGEGQKNLAIDLAVAPSTVALNAKLGFEVLGVHGRASRVHPLLMLAAKSDRDGDTATSARTSSILIHGRSLTVVSVDRPDTCLAAKLPPAELSVVRKLAEGVSYRDIAKVRGTSTRTIANQITAVFRRMRVSGRSDLLLRMFAENARVEQQQRSSAPPPVSSMRPMQPSVRRLEND